VAGDTSLTCTDELSAGRRNPEASRAAILAAAREAFAGQGFARATVRGIARRAGVTHGLVMMHFTSKEQLFLAAVPGHRELPEVVAGDSALLRSAASNVDAATRLYAAMQENSLALYQGLLPGPDKAARVELLGAQLIGVTFSRYIARTGRLAEMSPDKLRESLIPCCAPSCWTDGQGNAPFPSRPRSAAGSPSAASCPGCRSAIGPSRCDLTSSSS